MTNYKWTASEPRRDRGIGFRSFWLGVVGLISILFKWVCADAYETHFAIGAETPLSPRIDGPDTHRVLRCVALHDLDDRVPGSRVKAVKLAHTTPPVSAGLELLLSNDHSLAPYASVLALPNQRIEIISSASIRHLSSGNKLHRQPICSARNHPSRTASARCKVTTTQKQKCEERKEAHTPPNR
jgi:hypothetical protein